MTNLAQTAERYVNGSKARWANLCELAFGLTKDQVPHAALRLAHLTGESETSVSHRMKAVRFARDHGATLEQIKAKPQKQVVAEYISGKRKARTAPLVVFPHRLTPQVRDDLKELCLRLARVLGLKTYDEVFEFVLSQFAIATDQELLHAAGASGTGPSAVTAQQLKAHLLMWARFKKQWSLATLECEWSPGVGYNLADVLAIDEKGRVVEIEVKVTMSDLRNDLEKKEKHTCLRATFDAKAPQLTMKFEGDLPLRVHTPQFVSSMKNRIPARFYYAVPSGLCDQAKSFVEENVPYAGLLTDRGGWYLIESTRKAPVLHSVVPRLEEQWFIVKSQTSQFVRSYRKLIEMNSQFVLKPSKDEPS